MADRAERIQIGGAEVVAGDEVFIVREREVTRGDQLVRTQTKKLMRFKHAERGIATGFSPDERGGGWRSGYVMPTEVVVAGRTHLEWVEVADSRNADTRTRGGLAASVMRGVWPEDFYFAADELQAMGDDGTKWSDYRDALMAAGSSDDVDVLDLSDLADEFIEFNDYCQETYG